MNRQVYYL